MRDSDENPDDHGAIDGAGGTVGDDAVAGEPKGPVSGEVENVDTRDVEIVEHGSGDEFAHDVLIVDGDDIEDVESADDDADDEAPADADADADATQLIAMSETSDIAAAATTTTITETSAASATKTGIGAHFAKHKKAWLIAASATVFALLGTGAVAVGAATANRPAAVATAPATATPTPTVTTPPPRPISAVAQAASPLRTCSVAGLLGDSRFGKLQAQVLSASGELMFERDPNTASQTASSMKVLTAAAALNVLGPDFRATTRVVAGSEPGTIVLVGGGDLTLTRLPSGQEPVYTGAAHLDDLAAKTKAAWSAANGGAAITTIILDSSYFTGQTWGDTWPPTERGTGWLSHITALQVDADRANPQVFLSPRGDDPIGRAGSAFAAYFGNVAVEQGTAPAGASELASVQSQPLSVLIPQALIPSDNSLAEMIGRHIAIKLGLGSSIDAIATAIPQGLQVYGIDTSALRTADASGMSRNNAVPPSYFTQLFLKINNREGNLGIIRDGLPVAGASGTLAYSNRFFGANAIARGHVFAKSGSISSAYTLTGVIAAADGSTLIFAIFATGTVGSGARNAIDTLTTAFYSCGANLSNN